MTTSYPDVCFSKAWITNKKDTTPDAGSVSDLRNETGVNK
jgi:hypothetical protein